MRSRCNQVRRSAVVFLMVAIGGCAAAADLPANSKVRSLAATCAACHGTDGHAVAGPPSLRLAGMPKGEFVRQMRAFRDGTREATVMQQIAMGYDDEQTRALADFFAVQR